MLAMLRPLMCWPTLCALREKVLENLGKLRHVPSVPFGERPPDTVLSEEVLFWSWDTAFLNWQKPLNKCTALFGVVGGCLHDGRV